MKTHSYRVVDQADLDVFEVEQRGSRWFVTLVRPGGERAKMIDCPRRIEAEGFARHCADVRGNTRVRIVTPAVTL